MEQWYIDIDDPTSPIDIVPPSRKRARPKVYAIRKYCILHAAIGNIESVKRQLLHEIPGCCASTLRKSLLRNYSTHCYGIDGCCGLDVQSNKAPVFFVARYLSQLLRMCMKESKSQLTTVRSIPSAWKKESTIPEPYQHSYLAHFAEQFDSSVICAGIMMHEVDRKHPRVYLATYRPVIHPTQFEITHQTHAKRHVRFVPSSEWKMWKTMSME